MNKPVVVNYHEEYHETKPSLFRESENIDRVLQAIFDVCDYQQEDFIWLSQNLLNLDEAEGFHLDLIGGLVGQPRFLSDFNTEPYFGYEGSYQSRTFGSATDPSVGGYWNSRSYFNTSTARQLTDSEYRRLIKARAIYNQSNCTSNDLLEVVNLITDSENNTIQILRHGLIQITTDDETGILSYFVDRLLNDDNILPIAAGVRVGLEEVDKVEIPEGEGGTVEDFDYAVIKYRWLPSGGQDLDTRTSLTNPDRNNAMVGWDRLSADNGYLVWNGDNTANGVETVLLDVKKILLDFPQQVTIEADMRAFWYSTRLDGNLDIEFATYKGGTMQKSGYDFINTGGNLIQNLKVSTNTTDTNTDGNGERLAKLTYNIFSKTGSLTKI